MRVILTVALFTIVIVGCGESETPEHLLPQQTQVDNLIDEFGCRWIAGTALSDDRDDAILQVYGEMNRERGLSTPKGTHVSRSNAGRALEQCETLGYR